MLPGQVDIQSWRSKNGRIHAQIKDMCGILCGLVLAQNYKAGQQLVTDRDFSANAHFFFRYCICSSIFLVRFVLDAQKGDIIETKWTVLGMCRFVVNHWVGCSSGPWSEMIGTTSVACGILRL